MGGARRRSGESVCAERVRYTLHSQPNEKKKPWGGIKDACTGNRDDIANRAEDRLFVSTGKRNGFANGVEDRLFVSMEHINDIANRAEDQACVSMEYINGFARTA